MIVSPGATAVTPTWVARFETNVQVILQDAWARRAKSLFWDKIMDVRQSATGRDLVFWLLETARITSEGLGGNKRFDDLGAAFNEIVNVNSGAGLRLTTNEIRDNQMSDAGLRGMPALDFAASWARQVGGNAAYWPQQALISLITSGTTVNGYDGVPFFSTSHPVNGFNTGAGTFSNKISSKPLKVVSSGAFDVPTMIKNFSDILASIRVYTQANGLPRDVEFKYALAGPDMQMPLSLILEAKTYGGLAGSGVNENFASRWGIEPIIAPELTEAGVVYLIAEAVPGEGAPFIFQERDPYVLSTYSPETLAELNRRKEFEWHFDGRNAAAFGHPYLCVRVEAS